MLTFVGMEPNGLESCDHVSHVLDEKALSRATSDDPFAREAVAVLEELLQSVRLVARVRRLDDEGEPRALSRDEAILAGLMIRLAKLHEGLLEYCSPPRMELFAFLLRGTVETAVNLRFLLTRGSRTLFDAFVHDSLRLDKQLYDRVNATVKARGGPVMPMEYGMLEGIEKAFRAAGVELDDVDGAARPGWTKGGIYARFKALGLEALYAPYFAVQSNYVHGAWQELYEHHLAVGPSGTFLPQPDFEGLAVSPLIMAIDVLSGAAVEYVRAAAPESADRDVLEDRVAFCGQKGHTLRETYRRFRGMPSIDAS